MKAHIRKYHTTCATTTRLAVMVVMRKYNMLGTVDTMAMVMLGTPMCVRRKHAGNGIEHIVLA